jgi:type VI secretion system protein ImpG
VPGGWPVFEVERVGSYHHRSGEWIDYQHLFSGAVPERDAPCYHVVRRAEGVEGVQAQLAFTDAAGRPAAPPADTVSVWLTHTNGDAPALLEPGQIDAHGAGSPEFATFANITPVRQGGGFELERDRHWQLLSLFSIHPRQLLSPAGLQLLLEAAGGGRDPRIRDVRCELAGRLHRRTMVPARAITVELDGQAFGSAGEAYLFGRVVSRLLAPSPGGLVRHVVTVRVVPDGAVYTFEDGGER